MTRLDIPAAPPSSLLLLSQLFDYLPLGLVVLDAAGKVVVYNRAEEQLAGRSRSHVIGSDFFHEVAPCMNVRELGGLFRDQVGGGRLDTTVEMSFPFPQMGRPRDVRVRMSALDVEGTPYGYLIIEDTTLTRQAERMREKLSSLLVHDLKNPLSAIMANVEFVQDLQTVRDHTDAREALDDAMDGAKRLNRMTLNLLDLSRLSASQMPLRRAPTSLSTLLARAASDNGASARGYRSRIVIEPPADDPVASLDEDLLVRALDNLVENAIRHGRTVTLGGRCEPGAVVLTVRDDGPGMPLEVRQRLFEPYVQVVTPVAAERGSNRGLGLTFVQLVARAHGGDASVECPASGGTVFMLRLAV